MPPVKLRSTSCEEEGTSVVQGYLTVSWQLVCPDSLAIVAKESILPARAAPKACDR